MNRAHNDTKARILLALLVTGGAALLGIPYFLTPPAYLDLVLHDSVFASDLSTREAAVTQDGTAHLVKALVRKIGNDYVARIGRVDSGPGAFTVQVDGFRTASAHVDAPPLQNVRAEVNLTPTFGRLEIMPVNATVASQPVAATAREGARAFTNDPRQLISVDLPPGKHRLVLQAAGFCATEGDFDVREGRMTSVRAPLSPDLTGGDTARFVLHWSREPRDLDAHFLQVGTSGPRNPAHAYFAHKQAVGGNGAQFASLDVDEQHPEGYETVTVRDLTGGDYEYYVHLYAGQGTISDANATVQLYTPGCHVKTFAPPSGCSENVWSVTNVRNVNGRPEFIDQQRCEHGAPLLFGGKAPVSPTTLR